MSQLPFADFMHVVQHAPLVSIDLIIENESGEVLLGFRRNEPAGGFWFVPGGRVLKNERLDAAFQRLTQVELGIALTRNQAEWLGVYEHFYDTNAGRQDGFGTHYVVLAYRLRLTADQLRLPMGEQHDEYRWQAPAAILCDDSVHYHSRSYFESHNESTS
ncbi:MULTISPECIES: GDP-mannose mannosyl hydrolase [Deefgea]|uniref:GDP-mannose mannosyl hydrolase n=1 Tax=Deefgea chitinilytica TaxID=570276 RepID=A0ABS2CDY3_9NEIS|nr:MULTISPECIES: GDP-mannose mannosyl hydrolase [Deefgea]MBM5572358.1 GDP-mannose mannosyl hydrolase [Deefgea chitinilytica]MBM9889594.1 GDP-mannose mannosyl hydrolase [Deefgea sp. CFH1-16]